MTADTGPTPPEAEPEDDARLIGVVRAQLRRYRALTGAAEAGQAGVYLAGRDLARLADLADEALARRAEEDARDAAPAPPDAAARVIEVARWFAESAGAVRQNAGGALYVEGQFASDMLALHKALAALDAAHAAHAGRGGAPGKGG